MQNSHEHIDYLLQRYTANAATETEIRELFLWLKDAEDDSPLKEQVLRLWEEYQVVAPLAETLPRHFEGARNERLRNLPVMHRVHILKTSWFRYAAAVILLLGGAAVWWEISRSARNDGAGKPTVIQTADIAPGTNRAILTVGNQSINLSNNKTGIAVGKAVTYNDGVRIADASQLLQLTTPRGGQYQAILPDGTKVWLNAASSIKFPSKFTGATRGVEITGEAYLEVAKNSKQPFYVHTNKETVQVLGTSFDVNAYEDEEAEKTTLVDGSISVISNKAKRSEKSPRPEDAGVILKPGEQSVVKETKIQIQTINTDEVAAWHSGFFKFSDASIEDIMRQLARWYDLDVNYEIKVDKRFVITIPRNVPISQVLRVLELTGGVHFEIDGNKITVKS